MTTSEYEIFTLINYKLFFFSLRYIRTNGVISTEICPLPLEYLTESLPPHPFYEYIIWIVMPSTVYIVVDGGELKCC